MAMFNDVFKPWFSFELLNGVTYDQFERALVDMVKDEKVLLAKVKDVLENKYNIMYKGKLSVGIKKLSQVVITRNGVTEYLALSNTKDCEDVKVVVTSSERMFCVGFLKVNQEPSATGLGVGRQQIWVDGEDSYGQPKRIQIKVLTYGQFVENEFVCVCTPLDKSPFVCAKYYNMQPIQVLPWSSFVNSEGDDALAFFSKNANGSLSYRKKSVIGGERGPGAIVIFDEKHKKYLKGFSAYAYDDIRYSNVHEFDGDFVQLAKNNQVVDYNFADGNQFSVLVPQKENQADRTRHVVLDDCRWKALGSVGDSFNAGLSQIFGPLSSTSSQTEATPETSQSLGDEQIAQGGDVGRDLEEEPHDIVENTSIDGVEPVDVSSLEPCADGGEPVVQDGDAVDVSRDVDEQSHDDVENTPSEGESLDRVSPL